MILTLWLIPCLDIIPTDRLWGHYTSTPQPKFTMETWFDGTYQDQMEKHRTERTLIRNIFVRINNQIDFSWYNKANAVGVIVGKEGYLFEEYYIDAHLGRDFHGADTLNMDLQKLVAVRDTLQKLDVEVVIVIAVGKGTFYSELIPDSYDPQKKRQSNYEYISASLEDYGIPFIDCNRWFLAMKDTSRYPLMPKSGIHWSVYSQYIVADSLSRFIEAQTQKDLPDLVVDEIEESSTPQGLDNDIGYAMNLLFDIKDKTLAYPKVHFEREGNEDSIKVLGIGDSFLLALYEWGYINEISSQDRLLYYNRDLRVDHTIEHETSAIPLDSIPNYQKFIEEQDVILMMATEANFRFNTFFDFFNKMYDIYFPEENLNTKTGINVPNEELTP